MVSSVLLISSTCSNNTFKLEEGDLLFQDVDCGPTCDAIESVTKGYKGACLSHMGMVVFKADSVFVLEAINKGVVLTPLDKFLSCSADKNNNPKVLVGRIKSEQQKLLSHVLENYEHYLGKPYNSAFLPNSGGYYCSEMIYELFKNANHGTPVFQLAPMTFKIPNSDETYPAWQEYFNNLAIEIPEGVPGCNPGSISQSKYIEIIHEYGLPDGYNSQ